MKKCLLVIAILLLTCSCSGKEQWMRKYGHPTEAHCNKALRKAWNNPSFRTSDGPADGSCCGAARPYWDGVWQSMEDWGAAKK